MVIEDKNVNLLAEKAAISNMELRTMKSCITTS